MNIIIMLLGILISSYHVPIEFIMTEYFTRKKNNDQWYSSPTGPRGYYQSGCSSITSKVHCPLMMIMDCCGSLAV